MLYIYVGLAGMLGALARYGLGLAIAAIWSNPFPFATLTINLLGSFALGYLTHGLFKQNRVSREVATAVGTGLIGSFTTFSTFSLETILLLENGRLGLAVTYVLTSLTFGLFSSWLGYRFATVRQERRRMR